MGRVLPATAPAKRTAPGAGTNGWRSDIDEHREQDGATPSPAPPARRRGATPRRRAATPRARHGGAAAAGAGAGRRRLGRRPHPARGRAAPREPAPPYGRLPYRPPLAAPPAQRPPRDWGWPQCLAGLALALAPEALLYLAAGGSNAGTAARVTAGSAIALIFSSLVTYGWQLFAAWLFSLRRAAAGLRAWGFRKPNRAYFWAVPTALFAVYAVSIVHDNLIHPHQQQLVDQFPHSGTGFALFFVLAVVIAPVCEETFFRGFLFKGFANSWGWFWGAVVSSAIFSLAHLQLDIFVPIFALGLALCWVYRRTGSLWGNITLHASFNAISVVAWYLTVVR